MTLLPWAHETSAGFTLRGWHTPPSHKPLLQFLHGNGFCCRTYEPFLEHLAEHFDLWLCDLQGHGDSDHGGHFLGWNRNAELALDAFNAGKQQFGDVPHYACGHSFGGVLTSLMLAQHPGIFEKAVLLDPVLFPQQQLVLRGALGLIGQRGNALSKKTRTRRDQWPDRDAAYKALHNRGMFRGWEESAFRAHIEHGLRQAENGSVELKCQPSREAEVFESWPSKLWYWLPRIHTPTLLLHGDATYPFVKQATRRLTRVNPCVTARELPGGHCFMLEDSKRAAGEVVGFLAAPVSV
ncbi:alpha/beta fold hydrolase [Pseudomonas saliphila]|uniref:alpha/beta fold hydrolase n=1 Tax=Pseudomonas saliphila TaxID=2586906 RepID=UPI00123AB68A|nr:alpha/beta hydrolase [Pseudomonas saliphila]